MMYGVSATTSSRVPGTRPGRPMAGFLHAVESSIWWSCAIWYCARQSHYDRILPVQDRGSCLPESSGRAFVADAREIRQYQMHPTTPPEKRDGHPVLRASRFFPASGRGGTITSVLRMQSRKVLSPQFSGSVLRASRSAPGRHHSVKRVFSADLASTFKCRLPTSMQIAGRTRNELASRVFLGQATAALFQRCAEHGALLTR